MNPPLDGDQVTVVRVIDGRKQLWRAVVQDTDTAGNPFAVQLKLGPRLAVLFPEWEGISWCRGWSKDARMALSAAWALHNGVT